MLDGLEGSDRLSELNAYFDIIDGGLEHPCGTAHQQACTDSRGHIDQSFDRALRHRAMTEELQRLRRRIDEHELPNVIGESEAMARSLPSRSETLLS